MRIHFEKSQLLKGAGFLHSASSGIFPHKPQGLLSSLTPATTTAYPSPEPISDLTQINQFSNVVDGLRNADASPSQQQQYMLSKNPEALETILTPEQIMKLKQQGIL